MYLVENNDFNGSLEKQIPCSGELEKEWSLFTEAQIEYLCSKILYIELTEGCSIQCKNCCLEVGKGPTDIIPFYMLRKIVSYIKKSQHCISLYLRSEPLDYLFIDKKGKTYNVFDVMKVFYIENGIRVYITTALPKGKERLFLDNFHKIDRISVLESNIERINKILNMNLKPNFDRFKDENSPQFENRIQDFMNAGRAHGKPNAKDLIEFDNDKYKEGIFISPKGFFNYFNVKPGDKEKQKSNMYFEKITPEHFYYPCSICNPKKNTGTFKTLPTYEELIEWRKEVFSPKNKLKSPIISRFDFESNFSFGDYF
ncbi:hypothetical protein HGA92_03180 [Candidatus Gracilibacteria bacterium]|nr:hypothetical protein [Candidatus Gracilibacteria bacterium]NUJ99108.1 hypothetical protein [Candidatus Gracilibacteria bacterium]